ncbi:SsrA-binding protein, partial [Alphaproteobacteria bacterium]|nr:SsrA-binding protein [Alphaproteobacteria bacterium]
MSASSSGARKTAITSGRVSENRRARHDYQIEDTLEVGLI